MITTPNFELKYALIFLSFIKIGPLFWAVEETAQIVANKQTHFL